MGAPVQKAACGLILLLCASPAYAEQVCTVLPNGTAHCFESGPPYRAGASGCGAYEGILGLACAVTQPARDKRHAAATVEGSKPWVAAWKSCLASTYASRVAGSTDRYAAAEASFPSCQTEQDGLSAYFVGQGFDGASTVTAMKPLLKKTLIDSPAQ